MIKDRGLLFSIKEKRNIRNFIAGIFGMEIDTMWCTLSTITDIVFFLWNRRGRRFFFFVPRPLLTSVVFLEHHDTLLTTRGRQGFIVLVFISCFLRWSQMLLTRAFCRHTLRRFESTHGGFQRATPTRTHHTHQPTHKTPPHKVVS